MPNGEISTLPRPSGALVSPVALIESPTRLTRMYDLCVPESSASPLPARRPSFRS